MRIEQSNGDRFLDAFNRIEAALRKQAPGLEEVSFNQLVQRNDTLTRSQKDRLHSYRELRNSIVHEPRGEDLAIIADPRPEVVQDIEAEVELVENPPKVMSVLKQETLQVFQKDQPLTDFLNLVRAKDYSQSPVRLSSGKLGLITTNSVARWLSARAAAGGLVSVGDVTIGEVREFSEGSDWLEVRPRTLLVSEALTLFSSRGKISLSAIALTESGQPHEKPLVLVTRSDLPTLVRALEI